MKRELMFATGIVGLALVGVGIEAVTDPVDEATEVAAATPYVERAVFCPPAVDEAKSTSQMTVASASGAAIPVDLEIPQEEEGATPEPPRSTDLAKGSILVHGSDDGLPANAVGYGGHPIAGVGTTYVTPTEGAGGARCSERPSDFWYFPAGSSALGYDERLLLYNPFSDETSARVTFFTPSGESAPAGLDKVSIPSQGWEVVHLNEFAKTQDLLSVTVEARRGRVIAWRVLFGEPEKGPSGAGMSLGATDPAAAWYFPAGFLGDGVRQSFTVLNPNDEQATVTVGLVSGDRNVRVPNNLVQVPIPGRTSQQISLDKVQVKDKEGLTHVSAVLTASSEDGDALPVVAERSVAMDVEGAEGLSDEVGLTTAGERWMLAAPAQRPTSDALAIYNGSSKAATIAVTLLTQEGEKRPKSLSARKIPSGARVTIPLAKIADGEPAVALVTSDQPVVAERFGYSAAGSDIVDIMGRAVLTD